MFMQQRNNMSQEESVPDIWPENYYHSTDPARRLKFLEEAMERTSDEAAVQMKKLFELRYAVDKKGRYADCFLRAWMDLQMMADYLNSIFREKKNRKRAQQALHVLCLDQMDVFPEDMLYREMFHLVITYILACANDSSYRSVLCGFGKIGDEKLKEKISRDLHTVAETVPEALGMNAEFWILKKAVQDAEELYL